MNKEKNNCKMPKATVTNNDNKAKKATNVNRTWEKPVLEDVSGRVMAQPYIRFT